MNLRRSIADRVRVWFPSTYSVLGTSLFYASILPHLSACASRELPASVQGHALAFQRIDGGASAVSTRPIPTNGATVTVVGVGRGDDAAFVSPPVGNPNDVTFEQLDRMHNYARWPSSGTALYAAKDSGGGSDRAVSVVTPPTDEVTVAAVAVAGTRVQDVVWSEVSAGYPLRSNLVRTTGPATLVAFWWGDAGVRYDKHAVPSNGFRLVDAVLESGALVQCAVAVKQVTTAGTYDVTWRAWPKQGAQLWLVAIE